MYVPPEDNDSDFMLLGKITLDDMEGDYGVIFDLKNDRYGYTSDSHRRYRNIIHSWLENNELINAIRCFHPDCPLYLWRTEKFDKKGRIDHLLVPPKLVPNITEAR